MFYAMKTPFMPTQKLFTTTSAPQIAMLKLCMCIPDIGTVLFITKPASLTAVAIIGT